MEYLIGETVQIGANSYEVFRRSEDHIAVSMNTDQSPDEAYKIANEDKETSKYWQSGIVMFGINHPVVIVKYFSKGDSNEETMENCN